MNMGQNTVHENEKFLLKKNTENEIFMISKATYTKGPLVWVYIAK